MRIDWICDQEACTFSKASLMDEGAFCYGDYNVVF